MAVTQNPTRTRFLAKLTLIGFLLSFVLFQVASAELDYAFVQQSGGGWDLHSLWTSYLKEKPEVLFVGDSRTRQDVDVAQVSELLSAQAGRRVTVGKIAISNGQPGTMAAVMFRLSTLPHPPRAVIWNVSEYAFNENFPLYGTNSDILSMNDPFDPAYMLYSYSIDPQRDRLLRDYALPMEAYAPDLAQGSRCTLLTLRTDFRVLVKIPFLDPSVDPAMCHGAPYTDGLVDIVMTDTTKAATYERYRNEVINSWSFSRRQEGLLADGISRARRAGIKVALWVPPTFHLDAQAPSIYIDYLGRVSAVASNQSVPLVDLHNELTDHSDWWWDTGHLNRIGAHALAPKVAEIARELEASRGDTVSRAPD